MRQYQIDNLITVLASLAIVVVVTLLILRIWRREFEARHELRRQLVDKMTYVELAKLLETEDGRRSMAALLGDGDPGAGVRVAGRGVTLILTGLALGLSAAVSRLPLLGTAGLVAIAGGIGQLFVAWLIARERRA